MATERKSPDAIAVQTNLSGAVAAIQDDPDSPDGSWLTATSAVAATDLRVTFPTPTGNLTAGAGLQEFKAWVRKTAGTPNPTVNLEVHQGGALYTTLLTGTSITSTSGQMISGTWNSATLTDQSGADVECRIVSTPGTGSYAEALRPNEALTTATNLTGAYTDIADDPDSPDGNWLAASSLTANCVCTAGLSNPTGTISVAAGACEVRVLVRTAANGTGRTGVPTMTVDIYEGTTIRRTAVINAVSISPADTPMVKSATFQWDAAWNADNMRVRVTGIVGGASSNRKTIDIGAIEVNVSTTGNVNTVETGAVEWNLAYTAANIFTAPTPSGGGTAGGTAKKLLSPKGFGRTVLAEDSFSRSIAIGSGLGTGDSGETWVRGGANDQYVGVVNESAAIEPTAINSIRAYRYGYTAADNYEVLITWKQMVGRTAGGLTVRLRAQTDALYPTAYTIGWGQGNDNWSRSGGNFSWNLWESLPPDGRLADGDTWHMRLRIWGSTTVRIQAKAWKVASAEPAGWQLDLTDSSGSRVASGGQPGIGFEWANTSGGAASGCYVQNFQVLANEYVAPAPTGGGTAGGSATTRWEGVTNFEFRTGDTVPAAIAVARASVGTYWDANGVLQTATNNVGRIDHGGPVRSFQAKGLLIEETRTNVVLWNRDLTNAAWTPSNMTRTKSAVGIDGTAASATHLTATAGNATILQSITLASSARYQSAFVKRQNGSGTIQMTMDNGATWTAITVTSAWTRVTIPTQTLANPTVGFRIVTLGDSIEVDYVQNENGTYATSPIATTTAAYQRLADVPTCALSGIAYHATEGTVVCGYTVGAANGVPWELDDGDTNNRMYIAWGGSAWIAQMQTGTEQFPPTGLGGSGTTQATRLGFAYAYKANDSAFCQDGGTVATDTVCNVPTVTTLRFGTVATVAIVGQAWMEYLRYYTWRRPDAELKNLSNLREYWPAGGGVASGTGASNPVIIRTAPTPSGGGLASGTADKARAYGTPAITGGGTATGTAGPGIRTYDIRPTGAGGVASGDATTSYQSGAVQVTYTAPTPTGGGEASGTAGTPVRTWVREGSGGGTATGTVVGIRTYDYRPTGGAGVASGSVVGIRTYDYRPTGGAGVASGTATSYPVLIHPTPAPTGGGEASGVGGVAITKDYSPTGAGGQAGGQGETALVPVGLNIYTAPAPSGGGTATGTIGVERTWVREGVGGASASGAATTQRLNGWVVTGAGGGVASGTIGPVLITKVAEGSGGGEASGSGETAYEQQGAQTHFAPAPTGGGASSGSATLARTWVRDGLGGASASGGATLARTYVPPAQGGGAGSGAASFARTWAKDGTGGGSASGTGASQLIVAGVVKGEWTGEGGASASGTADTLRLNGWVQIGSGGGTSGGSAGLTRTHSPTSSGGGAATGIAEVVITKAYGPSGGGLAGGVAELVRTWAPTGSGGGLAGGEAAARFVLSAQYDSHVTAGWRADPWGVTFTALGPADGVFTADQTGVLFRADAWGVTFRG